MEKAPQSQSQESENTFDPKLKIEDYRARLARFDEQYEHDDTRNPEQIARTSGFFTHSQVGDVRSTLKSYDDGEITDAETYKSLEDYIEIAKIERAEIDRRDRAALRQLDTLGEMPRD